MNQWVSKETPKVASKQVACMVWANNEGSQETKKKGSKQIKQLRKNQRIKETNKLRM